MSFLLQCPNCGERNVTEFGFGGETQKRPGTKASFPEWTDYLYSRKNEAGPQQEWWYHRLGCKKWFIAIRDTTTNEVHKTCWFGDPSLEE